MTYHRAMLTTRTIAIAGFFSICGTMGCEPGHSGDSGGSSESGPSCRDLPAAVATLDEATPAGVTGGELLERARGTHAFVIQGPEIQGGHVVEYMPQSIGVAGTVGIAHAGGEQLEISRSCGPMSARMASPPTPRPTIAPTCPRMP